MPRLRSGSIHEVSRAGSACGAPTKRSPYSADPLQFCARHDLLRERMGRFAQPQGRGNRIDASFEHRIGDTAYLMIQYERLRPVCSCPTAGAAS